jgi:hypothetical protein
MRQIAKIAVDQLRVGQVISEGWTEKRSSGPSFATLNRCEPDLPNSHFPYTSTASSVAELSYAPYLA